MIIKICILAFLIGFTFIAAIPNSHLPSSNPLVIKTKRFNYVYVWGCKGQTIQNAKKVCSQYPDGKLADIPSTGILSLLANQVKGPALVNSWANGTYSEGTNLVINKDGTITTASNERPLFDFICQIPEDIIPYVGRADDCESHYAKLMSTDAPVLSNNARDKEDLDQFRGIPFIPDELRNHPM